MGKGSETIALARNGVRVRPEESGLPKGVADEHQGPEL